MLGLRDMTADQATSKMQETLDVVRQINTQFKNPVRHHQKDLGG